MHNKLIKLNDLLAKCRRVLVAYSGGVDSTFLLAQSIGTLGRKNVLAVTAVSETYPERELKQAKELSARLGVKTRLIHTKELENPDFRNNSVNRCFHCKDELFCKLKIMAKKNKMVLCDATNYSDRSDYRPGRRAAVKWGVKSPLLEAGITKDEIRKSSRKLNLPTWNQPAQACLASRIPFGTAISEKNLKNIEKGEDFLRGLGFGLVRIRDHGEIARIETDKKNIKKLLNINAAQKISLELKKLGWKFISVDIDGYKTGSLNPAIK